MSLLTVTRIAYIIATALFVLGLKRLGHPSTARQGNRLAAAGMGLAILMTLLVINDDAMLADTYGVTLEVGYLWIILGAAVGSGIGIWMARSVEMTSMPQLVALFNGLGGLASTCVGVGDFWQRSVVLGTPIDADYGITIGLSVVIGTLTFSGSLVAFAKLQGIMPGRPILWPGKTATSMLVAAICLGSIGWLASSGAPASAALMVIAALAMGLMLVLPIGGADMPVVIALLNAYSGMAASATGFVLENEILIVAGALVGASGLILTNIMCVAMNRSLANVMFGAFGGDDGAVAGQVTDGREMRAIYADDVAIQLAYAEKVIFVPGYGMAMAQAQHAVRELADVLEARDVTVKFAIHPVAGRMPGHMNVLLAEANVDYSVLFELEEINGDFPSTDVVVVIGANDTVNPDARDNPQSAIYGMPILEVDRARSVVVMKRGRGKGFAGIENPLFFAPNTGMLFGDAKDSVVELIQAVKQV